MHYLLILYRLMLLGPGVTEGQIKSLFLTRFAQLLTILTLLKEKLSYEPNMSASRSVGQVSLAKLISEHLFF